MGAALPLARGVAALFLSGGAEGTTPLRVGIPAAMSHFRASCFLGSAGLKDTGCQSHFKGPVFRKSETALRH